MRGRIRELLRYSQIAGLDLALGILRVKMMDVAACDKVSPNLSQMSETVCWAPASCQLLNLRWPSLICHPERKKKYFITLSFLAFKLNKLCLWIHNESSCT